MVSIVRGYVTATAEQQAQFRELVKKYDNDQRANNYAVFPPHSWFQVVAQLDNNANYADIMRAIRGPDSQVDVAATAQVYGSLMRTVCEVCGGCGHEAADNCPTKAICGRIADHRGTKFTWGAVKGAVYYSEWATKNPQAAETKRQAQQRKYSKR